MKILWLCNIMLPIIAKDLNMQTTSKEGWLSGTLDRIIEEKSDVIEIGIAFPIDDKIQQIEGEVRGIKYFGFYENKNQIETYDERLEQSLGDILDKYQPDIVHSFGTEYPHALAMARLTSKHENMLISIQGMMGIYADEYMAGLPKRIQTRYTLRDFLKKDNIKIQQEKFYKRAKIEEETLGLVKNVAGRTKADEEFTYSINENRIYFHLNETLRNEFYNKRWNIENCKRNTVLVTQADYPIKGFHILLEAINIVKQSNLDIKVVVTGNIITRYSSIKEKLKIGSYGLYIRSLIKKYKLSENIEFIGMVDEAKMCQLMIESHLSICPSVIENSPNSIGEAMLLGLPVIAARVGGIPTMMNDLTEGLLYDKFDYENLANLVNRLINDDNLAKQISESARIKAEKTHNQDANYKRLIEIYTSIKGHAN